MDVHPQTKEELYRSVKNQSKTPRKKTSIACISCWKAKTACSIKRPCERCERLQKGDSCVDRPASTRKRQFLLDKKKPKPQIRKKKKSKTTQHNRNQTDKSITGNNVTMPAFSANVMPTFQINSFNTLQMDNKLKDTRMKKKGMKRVNAHDCCNGLNKCKKRRLNDMSDWTDDKNSNCNTEIEKQKDRIELLIKENNQLKLELNGVKIAEKEKNRIAVVNNHSMQQQIITLKKEIHGLKTQNNQLLSEKEILVYKIT
eukprot:891440_1